MLYMPCSYYYRLSCKINVVFIFNSFYLLHLFRQVYRFVKPFEHTAVVITLKTGYWNRSYFLLCPVFCCAFVKMQHCFFAGIWWFAYNIELQRFFFTFCGVYCRVRMLLNTNRSKRRNMKTTQETKMQALQIVVWEHQTSRIV